jgi:hypothetical protein
MNLITVCKYCGARNYFSRKTCGYCGAKLPGEGFLGLDLGGFNLKEYLRKLSTTKLLIGLMSVVVIIVVCVVVWQFAPKADASGPQIYGITVDSVTATSARIIWYTDEPSSSQVEYGRSYNYGQLSPMWPADDPTTSDSIGVTAHYVILKALGQNTTYYFKVISKDARGNEAESQEIQSFKTGETLPFYLPDAD